MEKDSERAQDQRKEDVPGDKKCGPKISHMVITQPSTDLNKYMVDNFIRQQLHLNQHSSNPLISPSTNLPLDVQHFAHQKAAFYAGYAYLLIATMII